MKRNKVKPVYGFGTHRLKGDECYKAVLFALKKGYNLFDTAEKYFNGTDIGRAMEKSRRKRESYQIVHKLTDVDEFTRTTKETKGKVNRYLEELGTEYIDILLMHGPAPRYHETPEDYKDGNIVVWETMYQLKLEGKLKAVGVSNFNKEQMMYLIDATGVVPEYLEVQFNVLNVEEVVELKGWTDRMGIQIIGYSPLAEGKMVDIIQDNDYTNFTIEQEIPMLPAEYALRFCITNGVIPIPRSSNKNRIKQNLKSMKKGSL